MTEEVNLTPEWLIQRTKGYSLTPNKKGYKNKILTVKNGKTLFFQAYFLGGNKYDKLLFIVNFETSDPKVEIKSGQIIASRVICRYAEDYQLDILQKLCDLMNN